MENKKTWKWGILSAGKIVNDFCICLSYNKRAEITAIGSRSLEKSEKVAKIFDIKKAYGSYKEVA